MSKAFGFLLLLLAVRIEVAAADLAPVAPQMDCALLKTADFSGVADAPVHVTSATAIPNGQPAPYCDVIGYVEPRVEFEVRLPLVGWTQRFLETGCGGLCGNLNIRVSNADTCEVAQRGEFALASTSMGHKGPGGDWGDNPALRIDFAYRGVHVTTLAAKAIIAKYYGQPARYSYFAGCSDGGREALMEAQRYPNDFDGITAGAPAMNFITQNTFYHGWNARVNTDANGHAILTAEQLPILHAAAVAACGAADGLRDGLISDPRACHFDPAVTECKAGQSAGTCLTAEQIDVARKIYQGAHDSEGRQLVISGPQPGSELAWRGVFVPNNATQPVMSQMFALDTIKHLAFDKNPPATFTLADFHFDRKTFNALKAGHELYDATNPNLKKFAAHGGKLILWHGWSDPHISPLNTIAYFSAVENFMGKEPARKFVRLYLFPGGYHCGGGEGPFDVDLLSPIMAWVESDKSPQALIASHRPGPGKGEKADRTRPVFPYPLVASYTGSGSIDDAANFVAKQPAAKFNDQPDWLGAPFFRANNP
jgi:feruloyl esterase